jgi:hypothetical protein
VSDSNPLPPTSTMTPSDRFFQTARRSSVTSLLIWMSLDNVRPMAYLVASIRTVSPSYGSMAVAVSSLLTATVSTSPVASYWTLAVSLPLRDQSVSDAITSENLWIAFLFVIMAHHSTK